MRGSTEIYKNPLYLTTFICFASIQLILASCVIYGYSSLLVVFKKLNLYRSECGELLTNTTLQHDIKTSCPLQDKALNLPFAVAMVLNCVVKMPLGSMIDKYGAKSCQYIGCLLLIGFGFSLGYTKEGKEYLLFVSFIFLSLGTSFLMLCPFQVTNILYTKKKSLFISLLSGCVDGSTVVFIIFLELYQAHLSFSSICVGYTVGISLLIMISTHFLVPSKEVLEYLVEKEIQSKMRPEDSGLSEEESLCKMRSEDFSASYMSSYDIYHKAILKSLEQLKETERREALLASLSQNLAIQYHQSSLHHSFSNSGQIQPYGTITENIVGFEPDSYVTTSYFDNSQSGGDKKPLLETEALKKSPKILTPYSGDKFSAYYFSKMNLLCTYTTSIMLLKIVYFIGNLDKYLLLMTDINTATKYIKLFGYLQFGGVIAAPVCGLMFINRRETMNKLTVEEDYFEKIKLMIIPAIVLTSAILLLDTLQLFENLQFSIPIFILYLVGNSMVFCYVSIFYAFLFPAQYYCSFFGICIGVCGIVSFLQYPLLYVEQDILDGKQFWVNLMFLFAIMSTFILPIYLTYYYHRYKPSKKTNKTEEEENSVL